MSSATDFRVTSQAMAEDNDEQASKQVDMSSGNVHESEKQVFASQDGSLSAWQFVCLSISLSLGLFLSFMDGSITSTAIYSIGRDFDDISDINWIAVAYFLSDVGLAVPITALSDVIGRFNAWLLAEAIFTAFSLACGFAQSLSQLIAFRCLQGVGGSGLYALGIVIWQEASTPDQRIWMGACIGFVVALAGVMGPILGGIIADKTTWRWIFWINPPIVLVSAALFIVAWPRHGKLKQHADPKSIRKFDVLGCFLLIVGCVLPTFAFQHQGQSGASWDDPLFIGSLVGGTVSWVLLILWQVRAAAHPGFINPVLPLHLLRHRRLAATAINSLFMGFGLFTVVYDVPLRLQIVNGKSPLQGGLGLLTMLCCAAVASFLGPGFSRKRDLLCHTLIIGSVLMALGLGLLSTLSEGPEVQSKLYGFQTLVGLGFGLLVSVAGIIVNIECRTTDHAIGQGLVAQARVLGGSLGLAASTAIVGEKRNLFAGSLDAWRPTPEALAFRESMWLAAAMLCGAFLAACFTWSNSKTPIAVRLAHNEDDEEEQNK